MHTKFSDLFIYKMHCTSLPSKYINFSYPIPHPNLLNLHQIVPKKEKKTRTHTEINCQCNIFVCVEVKVRRLTFHLTRTQNATSMMQNFTNLLSMSGASTHTQILFIVILQNFALKTEKEHEGKIYFAKSAFGACVR